MDQWNEALEWNTGMSDLIPKLLRYFINDLNSVSVLDFQHLWHQVVKETLYPALLDIEDHNCTKLYDN